MDTQQVITIDISCTNMNNSKALYLMNKANMMSSPMIQRTSTAAFAVVETFESGLSRRHISEESLKEIDLSKV